MPDFILRAESGVVEITVPGDVGVVLRLSPRIAQSLARNLNLYAEKAEIIARRGPDAAVGPRIGVIGPDGADHA